MVCRRGVGDPRWPYQRWVEDTEDAGLHPVLRQHQVDWLADAEDCFEAAEGGGSGPSSRGTALSMVIETRTQLMSQTRRTTTIPPSHRPISTGEACSPVAAMELRGRLRELLRANGWLTFSTVEYTAICAGVLARGFARWLPAAMRRKWNQEFQ